eukprot:scaffold312006_cov41-Tisochrysis_lutea.AAC.2
MSVPPLTEEDIEMCREAFTKFDLDGSGAISAYELRETLACAHPALLARSSHIGGLERSGRSLACSHTPLTCLSGAAMGQRLSQEEIFDMVARVDADGSGEIGGNEDKTGEISVEKLKMVINEFGLTIDIQRFVEETDTDGSGLIDFTEFKTMLAESEADTNDLP